MTSRSSKSNGNNKNHQNNRILNNLMIGDFKIGTKLGQGTFSKVCQGIHMPTGEKVAIKIMSKDQIKEKTDQIRIEKEINIQKKLHHQNIVQQYAIIETKTTIYIISEYCSGGELFDYIVSKRKLYEVEACRIYQQLISGLEYLHKQRICHRDLKPENLLFDSKHILKIADFGLSNDYHKGKLSTPCGSPCYAAPEMVTGKKYSGSSVDIWSSGIVLYTMVCGFLPFEDDNQNILFGKIAKGLFSLPSFLSASCKDLLKKILVTDPKKRYGFEEIKHHTWFMSVNNVMGKNIFFNSPGVFIEEDVIPIDVEIIAEMYNDFHIDISKIINEVLKNRHNKITTTYYLILKRKVRNNENSVSDISSNSTSFIKYIKSSISKMGYWNNDYDKITEHYVKLVRKYLNSISEETSMSIEPKSKNNGSIISNKENNNLNNNIHNIKTSITNIDKLNLKKITNNNNISSKDHRCYTELSDNSNKSNKNINKQQQNNNLNITNTVQNGGIDIRINASYDDKGGKNIQKIPLESFLDTKIEKNKNININKIDYELESEEPPIQKINDSYKPKITIQEFLQTDTNNIKMNNRLIKEANNLEKAINKFNMNINNINNNNKNLISEESNNIPDNKNNSEQKETAILNVDRILLTELDNIDIKNLKNSLLNKNNNHKVYSKNKNMQNDIINKNNDYVRINTLYNKDDSDDNIKLTTNDNNSNIQRETNNNNEETKIIFSNKKNNITLELENNNNTNNIPFNEINGLNENNFINNNINHNRTKSIEKIKKEESNNNNKYIKNYFNQNKEKTNKYMYNMAYLPTSNQIIKRLATYSDRQDKIQKFINQKNSSMPKKEDSKRDNLEAENGNLLIINKNKYKNKYTQEYSHIHNEIPTRTNGSNEISINKNIINANDILYMKKKKRPKSIDENKNYNNYKDLKLKENNNNSFNRKDSKTNINNNDFYIKMKNNNKKIIYKDLINNKKYIDESYIDSFRYKNINKKNNIYKLNKKIEINDLNNISHIINKRNNNYFVDKKKNRENYILMNKDQNNYTNITTNKNHKLHEHNSFDIPKKIKNKLNRNFINNSIEKDDKYLNNNNNIAQQYNFKISKKKNHSFRNINNNQNPIITKYYGINNHNNINNYNIDNYNKLSNEKIRLNKRINNYRIVDKIKSNSVDLPSNINKDNTNDIKNIYKNKRRFYLNTSVIKDKTPNKLNTSFLLNKHKQNNNIKNNYYINTLEKNNYINNNINKNLDDGRYLTFKDNESISTNSTRTNQFHKYLYPIHKRYNFSQEPEKKRKENDTLGITTYGKGNSFILSKPNNFLFNKDKYKKRIEYKNCNNINQFNNKNILYENQKFINSGGENKINGSGNNIYCKKSTERIKENVEKIIGNKANLIKLKNSSILHLECKYKEGTNIINFNLDISRNSDKKDYLIISPYLIKGNPNTYRLIIEKIKNKLM